MSEIRNDSCACNSCHAACGCGCKKKDANACDCAQQCPCGEACDCARCAGKPQ